MAKSNQKSKLGILIEQHRKPFNLTQHDVATHLGMVTSTYAPKEREGRFTEDELQKLAKLLKISLEVLVDAQQDEVVNIPDSIKFLTTSIIRVEAKVDVVMGILSHITGHLTKKKAEELLKLWKGDVDRNIKRRIEEMK